MKTQPLLLVVSLCMLVAASCVSVGTSDHQTVDTSDPQEVAEAAWQAIIERDYERARSYVIPDDRSAFTQERIETELGRLPPLPKSPVIRAEINGNRGEALIENWEQHQGLDMVKKNGRWWIEN